MVRSSNIVCKIKFILLLTILFIYANTISGEDINISILGLFKPQEIRLCSGSKVPLEVTLDNGERMYVGDNYLTVSFSGDHLEVKNSLYQRRPGMLYQTRGLEVKNPAGIKAPPFFQIGIPGKLYRYYRGRLQILTGEDALTLILSVALENAVETITFSEIQDSKDQNFITAMSIVVRSFLLSEQDRHPDEPFQFCDATHCQLYYGNDAVVDSTLIIPQSRDLVMTFNNQLITPFYCHSCGGYTADPEDIWGHPLPYIIPTICPYCQASENIYWTATLPRDGLIELFGTDFSNIRIEQDSLTGIVKKVRLNGKNGSLDIIGEDFRIKVGQKFGWGEILSNKFDIEDAGDVIHFTGRGKGHGIGLCLLGARQMASEGKSYVDILNYYYPRVRLTPLQKQHD
ncbi:SpoIID/LytB domain-containing protein [bacterium]|nr:SpoIID/LytB domain-containing protein [bacterium]